jgi:two-component system NarL family sensor kinase
MDEFDRPGATARPDRVHEWLPFALAGVLAIVVSTAILGLRMANGGLEPDGRNWWLLAWIVAGCAFTAAGAAMLTTGPRRALGASFVVIGIAAYVAAVAEQYAAYAASTGSPPGWPVLADASRWAWPLGGAVLVGMVPWELVPRAWRSSRTARSARLLTAASIAVLVAGRLDREAGDDRQWPEVLAAWTIAAAGSAATMLIAWHWWRLRRSSDDALAGWLLAGVVVSSCAVVPYLADLAGVPRWWLPDHDVAGPVLLMATVPLLVVGSIIEVVRRGSSGAERASHRLIEWTLFAGGIVVLYTGVVAGLGTLVGGSGPTWLLVIATGAVAVLAEPARGHVRTVVDRLVYGSRDDPLAVVQRVVDHVGTNAGDELLPALVASLERELRLDAVAIDIAGPDGWHRAASVGAATAHEREVSLSHRDEVVGRLVVGWDAGPGLRSRDERVLQELAGPVSLAVGWVRLAAELRRSGAATVSAREEERRRLRRDLHDGLGPTLTGVSLGLRTAVKQVERAVEPAASAPVRDLLLRLADEIDDAVDEIKRIVRDLRPTALDQLGLIGAVAEFARRFGDDIDISVELPPANVELPAAVEVAVYRIVTEALTNVVRHAHAARCWLSISAGATVEIDVVDDGVGIDERGDHGVGLTAMRERVDLLGGDVRFVRDVLTGTHLHVCLPAVVP